MATELVIPYSSVPDYDEWGFDSYWNLATWVGWHRGLVQKFGRTLDKDGYPLADKIWLNAWVKQSSYSSPILAILQPARFKSESDYLKQYPLLYEYTGLKRATEQVNPLNTTYKINKLPFDVAEKTVGAVSDASSAVTATGKVLKYGIPIVIVVGLGLVVWYGVRKVKAA